MNRQRRFIYYMGLPFAVLISIWLYLAFFPIVSETPGVIYYLKPGTRVSGGIRGGGVGKLHALRLSGDTNNARRDRGQIHRK